MWAVVAAMCFGSVRRNAEEVVSRISADAVDIDVPEIVAHRGRSQTPTIEQGCRAFENSSKRRAFWVVPIFTYVSNSYMHV